LQADAFANDETILELQFFKMQLEDELATLQLNYDNLLAEYLEYDILYWTAYNEINTLNQEITYKIEQVLSLQNDATILNNTILDLQAQIEQLESQINGLDSVTTLAFISDEYFCDFEFDSVTDATHYFFTIYRYYYEEEYSQYASWQGDFNSNTQILVDMDPVIHFTWQTSALFQFSNRIYLKIEIVPFNANTLVCGGKSTFFISQSTMSIIEDPLV
jgi:hypothetical protein